jgi:hypothetical protein
VDEATAIVRAIKITRRVTKEDVSLPIGDYLKAMDGLPGEILVRVDETLGDGEAGSTLVVAGRRCIIINGNDRVERQRFTVCHELGHILLNLPTEHDGGDGDFVRRAPNEVFCDMFAAEVMLPRHLFGPDVADSDLGFEAVERLSARFSTSLAATGSQFATACDRPCAFVLARNGIVRHAARSRAFKEAGGWIPVGKKVPTAAAAAALARQGKTNGTDTVEALEWLDGWRQGGSLIEDSRHFPKYGETLSLLWFEDDRVPDAGERYDDQDDEEAALQPLDGILPWPGRSRRRR